MLAKGRWDLIRRLKGLYIHIYIYISVCVCIFCTNKVYPTLTVSTSLLVIIVSRLWAGRSGDRIPAGAQDSSLPNRQDRHLDPPSFWVPGLFPAGKRPESVAGHSLPIG